MIHALRVLYGGLKKENLVNVVDQKVIPKAFHVDDNGRLIEAELSMICSFMDLCKINPKARMDNDLCYSVQIIPDGFSKEDCSTANLNENL